MKLLNLITLSSALALILSGCGSSSPTPPEDVIDTTLPTISLNGHFEDMKSVAFEWKETTDPRVSGVYIYRNNPSKDDAKMVRYATLPSRFATHYVDNNVVPNTKYQYFFTTFSDKAQSSKSEISTITTLPILEPIAWIQSVQNMPRSAKILWRPYTNPRVNGYVIERKSLKDEDFVQVAQVEGRLSAEYIDAKLDDGQIYKYRVKAITFDNVLSQPSEIVQAVTKQLPADVVGLSVTNNLPRKIDLTWQKSNVSDFDYYKLYRGESATGTLDFHAKLLANSFSDAIKEDGKQYFYRVTVVDKDGLESDASKPALQGITLTKPKAPDMMEAKILNNQAQLRWTNTDRRVKSFTVIKTAKKGWFDTQIDEIRGITDTSFIDTNIYSGVVYTYQVMGVDEFNIASNPSAETTIASDLLPPEGEQKRVLQNKTQNTQAAKPAVKPAVSEAPINSTVEAAPDLDTGSL